MKPVINITGGTRQQRSLVQDAADFYLQRLLSAEQVNDLTVDIELIKNLLATEGCKADTVRASDETENEFELRIDSTMNMNAILLALAHECVHIRQYVSDEMRDKDKWYLVEFQGKVFNMKKVNYFDLPWEIEAYGREHGLLYHYVGAKKLTKARWYTRDPDFL